MQTVNVQSDGNIGYYWEVRSIATIHPNITWKQWPTNIQDDIIGCMQQHLTPQSTFIPTGASWYGVNMGFYDILTSILRQNHLDITFNISMRINSIRGSTHNYRFSDIDFLYVACYQNKWYEAFGLMRTETDTTTLNDLVF